MIIKPANRILLSFFLLVGVVAMILLFKSVFVDSKQGNPIKTPLPVYSFYSDLAITPVPNGKICWDADQVATATPPANALQDLKDLGDSASASNPGDTGMAFEMNNVTNARKLGFDTYLVPGKSGQSIALFNVYNPALPNGKSLHLRTIALLDDHQLSISFSVPIDTQIKPYDDLILTPQQFASFNVPIPALTTGVHELIVQWIREPQTDNDFNTVTNAGAGESLRVTLIVGQVIDNINRPVSPTPILHDSAAPFLNLTLDQPFKQWVLPQHAYTLTNASSVSFFVEAKHQGASSVQHPSPPNQAEKIALILFVDGVQTAWPDQQLVTYADLVNDDDYVRVPAKVTFPAHSGQHEIAVLRIDYPGVPMCFMWGNPDGMIFPQVTKTTLVYVNAP